MDLASIAYTANCTGSDTQHIACFQRTLCQGNPWHEPNRKRCAGLIKTKSHADKKEEEIAQTNSITKRKKKRGDTKNKIQNTFNTNFFLVNISPGMYETARLYKVFPRFIELDARTSSSYFGFGCR